MPVICLICGIFWKKTTQLHALTFTNFVWTPNENFAYVTEEKQHMNYIKVFLPFLKTTEGNKRYKAKMTQETFFPCLSGQLKMN